MASTRQQQQQQPPKPTPAAAAVPSTAKKTSNVAAAVGKGKRKRPRLTASNRDTDTAAAKPASKQSLKSAPAAASTRTLKPPRDATTTTSATIATTAVTTTTTQSDDDRDDDMDERDDRGAKSSSNSNSNSETTAHNDSSSSSAVLAAIAAIATADDKPKPRRGRRRLLHDEEQRKQRRKNQCKLNQRRYRARQRGMISALSLETDTLSEHIAELEAYERFLRAFAAVERAFATGGGANVCDTRPLLVVDHFVAVFRHGFALHSVDGSELQERFVRFIAAPTLVSQGATCSGVDALLLQLKRYTSYHAVFALDVDARRVLHSPDPNREATGVDTAWVVEVSGRMHLRLSRDTVMLVYPHIVADEALSYRVVGHAIDPAVTIVFQFNDSGQVSKLELAVDFAGAFMALLHSAADVATLLGAALISPHCELGIEPHDEAARRDRETNKQLSLKFILL